MAIDLTKHKVLQHGDSFPTEIRCDVCIIGSGAGGGTLAAGLAAAGMSVVMIESGRYQDQADFTMEEDKAFQQLYQDRGLRSTEDLSMVVMQGHCVGGGTTVNWTTCFRTPERILNHWKTSHGVDFTGGVLDPHFAATEQASEYL